MTMQKIRLDEDIKPLSEFRANAAALLERVRSTKRPLVLTQRGHSSAVVVDVSEYERLLDELELLRDVRIAEAQLARGEGIPHEEAKARVLSALRR
jgi:prevent-host-death family protein